MSSPVQSLHRPEIPEVLLLQPIYSVPITPLPPVRPSFPIQVPLRDPLRVRDQIEEGVWGPYEIRVEGGSCPWGRVGMGRDVGETERGHQSGPRPKNGQCVFLLTPLILDINHEGERWTFFTLGNKWRKTVDTMRPSSTRRPLRTSPSFPGPRGGSKKLNPTNTRDFTGS